MANTKQPARVLVTSRQKATSEVLLRSGVQKVELEVGDITLTLTLSEFGTAAEIVVQSNALIQLRHSGDGFVLTRQG